MNPLSTQDINDRQNDASHLRLLQAADVEHAKAQRVESTRWIIALAISGAGLAAMVFPSARVVATIAGVFAAVLTELVWPRLAKNLNTRAVLIQEQFDTSLFDIGWNSDLGRKIPLVHVNDAANQYKKTVSKKDWYLNVRGIPSPVAETLCQRENLIWDADQREEWARKLAIGLGAWLVLGLGISFAGQLYVWQLCTWYIAPTLPAATLALRSVIQQRTVARTKIELREQIDEALLGLSPDMTAPHKFESLKTELRSRQDKIFRTRLDSSRIPERFYNRLRARYEANHHVDAEHFRSVWAVDADSEGTTGLPSASQQDGTDPTTPNYSGSRSSRDDKQ